MLTDLILRRQWVLWGFSAATFLVFLYYPETRKDAIIGAWSAILLGLVVSVLVTARSEDVIRRDMLRRYQNFATWTIKPIMANAVRTARVAFDLPEAIAKDLREGGTRAVERRAYRAAWEHIKRKEPGADTVALVNDKPAMDLIGEILKCVASIKEEADAARALLDRLTSIQWPLYLYLYSAGLGCSGTGQCNQERGLGPVA